MQDPKVQEAQKALMEAQKAFMDTLEQAMLAADPTIGPLLEKMRAGRGGDHREDWGRGEGYEGRRQSRGPDKGPSPAPTVSPAPTP